MSKHANIFNLDNKNQSTVFLKNLYWLYPSTCFAFKISSVFLTLLKLFFLVNFRLEKSFHLLKRYSNPKKYGLQTNVFELKKYGFIKPF